MPATTWLAISLAQYNALGSVTLTAGDAVALTDTGATLGGLTAAVIGDGLAGNNVNLLIAYQ